MKEKAIAYVSDVIIGRTGEVVSREYQKDAIAKYAAENDIEIMAWFEDRAYNEDFMKRTGVQEMLAFKGEYSKVLVERVWALSRKMSALEELFRLLDRKKAKFETATTMWDAVSQMVRRRYNPALGRPVKFPEAAARQKVYVATPVKGLTGLKVRVQES